MRTQSKKRLKIILSVLVILCAVVGGYIGLRSGRHSAPVLAIDKIQRAAERGNPRLQYDLGQLYLEGTRVDRNYPLAAKWFKAAADHRVTDAYYPLAYLYATGNGVDSDYAQAERYLRLAASSGSSAACYGLGLLLIRGAAIGSEKSIPPNPSEAVSWYKKAAERGLPEAQCALAEVLAAQGNAAESENWYRAAAESGFAKAQCALAQSMESHQTISSEPIRWYRKAADGGYGPAAYRLGELYVAEHGVARNLSEAYYWFSLAETLGSEEAAARCKELAAEISTASIARAQRDILKWSPRQPPKTDNEPYTPLL